jgi:hypothetical protein
MTTARRFLRDGRERGEADAVASLTSRTLSAVERITGAVAGSTAVALDRGNPNGSWKSGLRLLTMRSEGTRCSKRRQS